MTHVSASIKRPGLRTDVRGTALMEFALVLPFMALLYIGGYQLADGIAAYRKVTTTTRAIADLTSQYVSISKQDEDIILAASRQVMAPYSTDNAALIVSHITTNSAGVAVVDWSQGLNATPRPIGQIVTIPTGLAQNNTSLVMSEINYRYTPVLGGSFIGAFTLKDRIYMSPRRSDTVEEVP